ncbi:iron(III) transport system permease protein [Pseudoalteromonas ulvae UL12]|uniref:Iron ABC transporter permease n=1 Tax=Pseudoalteromonas ulvae TaxID=107327 RepID=A0A244CTT8_PSEDV|nr:iron ABC transporter permease [Pseudoalteromonas ulvae]MBE0363027.1 iron(III) transport system permease protein [Pseudoalteromonas ulvae UL12]OUL59023.1 iron ABC transporter permease [Pseudoalteromonas ulvae]
MHLRFSLSKWQVCAWAAGLLLSLPLAFLIFESFQPSAEVFDHLWQTVLWDYTANTILLIIGVALVSSLIALPLGWLVAYCDFPGKKHFEWALMLPLAMPAYIIAYIYTDLFDFAGPVQVWLRSLFGWQSAGEYWFFDIRTLPGAIIMIALVLYPYLYLIFKTALKEQSHKLIHASQLMGHSAVFSFFKVSLPLARGSIVAGLALISMEAMADFATVHYFAVSTLTTAVYDTWLGYYSLTAAAKISAVMLLILFLTLGAERFSRRNQHVFERQSVHNHGALYTLKGVKAYFSTGFCLLVLGLGFIIPVVILFSYAVQYFEQSWQSDFFIYAWQSLTLASIVSFCCVLIGLFVVYAQRLSDSPFKTIPGRIGSAGYALPGTVLAIAVLLPLTRLDEWVNHFADSSQWFSAPGLFFSGTIFALIVAYVVRFYAIAQGTIEASFARISPSLDMASASMGRTKGQTLRLIHLPLMHRGILTAGLLVFIECMKELPAALLLRPFDFETLATHVYQYVSDEHLELAAFSALLIVLVGLLPLYFVNSSMERTQSHE